MKKLSDRHATVWRTDVREITEALGIPLAPNQWAAIERSSGPAIDPPLDTIVHIVVSESTVA